MEKSFLNIRNHFFENIRNKQSENEFLKINGRMIFSCANNKLNPHWSSIIYFYYYKNGLTFRGRSACSNIISAIAWTIEGETGVVAILNQINSKGTVLIWKKTLQNVKKLF